MSEAHEYRKFANDCIKWARIATSDDQRAYLVELAKKWRGDAKELERANASEMAGREIDLLGDPSATDEERQLRKQRLIKGPEEFRDIRQRLRELAWIDGRSLAIEYRWAEGRNERYAEAAAELVRLKVDVIVTVATPATLAAKQATTFIPIVFGAASDPVGTCLVESLARPGGNITGLSNQISDTGGKKLEFLREVVSSI
jgi:ABC transporter substrate binding protein